MFKSFTLEFQKLNFCLSGGIIHKLHQKTKHNYLKKQMFNHIAIVLRNLFLQMLFSIKTTRAKTYQKIMCEICTMHIKMFIIILICLFMYVLDVNAIISPY
jgi:hypothetical protein